MPRAQKPTGKSRHDPLAWKRRKSHKAEADDGDDDEVILDPKTSKRIFELARDQQEELGLVGVDEEDDTDSEAAPSAFQRPRMDVDDDEEEEDEDPQGYDEDVEEVFEIDAGDMETLDALLPANSGERKTLADLIFAKLDDAGTPNAAVIQKTRQDPDNPDPALGLDPRVVEVYTKLGLFLQKYKSGPLPKIFKVIPSLPAWARMLALTHPENWSPHACRAATKIFISNMKPPQAQLFLSVVLLDAIREDIQQNKKLNVHYYEALKRSLYKPGAFFKGIIFPMLDQGCTLKEAAIVASILARTKIPASPGPNSLFIRVLIDKKFELPYKVVDALVFHFIRLSNTYKALSRGESDKLPVLWHQSLLVFAQRYASDLTPDQKDALLDVVRATPHVQIGPEIRRELVTSVVRGAPRQEGNQDVEMS
ncbi:Bystin-domain-containing protein [Armillaria mellea]|nr:Bystin-domain-containing protein [Armillaria mellea]